MSPVSHNSVVLYDGGHHEIMNKWWWMTFEMTMTWDRVIWWNESDSWLQCMQTWLLLVAPPHLISLCVARGTLLQLLRTPLRIACTCIYLYQTMAGFPQTCYNIPRPLILSFIRQFPLFSSRHVSSHVQATLRSESVCQVAVCSIPQVSLAISVTTDHSTGGDRPSLMCPGAT